MVPSSLFRSGRHAGMLLPLAAAPGRHSWGVGEIGDLPVLGAWLREAGLNFLQVLPLNEMLPDQNSPYGAVSAMAIDPIFISLRHVWEYQTSGGEDSLDTDAQCRLSAVRRSHRIDYNAVRTLKMEALRSAFDKFRAREWTWKTARACELHEYIGREAWWLHDYALYRALRDRHQSKPWWQWEPALARRDERALRHAREQLADECLFFAYLQWLADTQWRDARFELSPAGVFGDMPFMVGSDSADVWACQHAFRLDASVGAPPDAFSAAGQDWSLPAYRWDVLAADDYAWLRARAKRNAALFDGYRVDHLVGFYRTFIIPADGAARVFSPADQHDQLTQGERIMRALLEPGATVIAEDLGTVPDFVRASLQRLGIAGYKVLRWEREWRTADKPFRDPAQYPEVSVATTGTHDTETLAEWWDNASLEERSLVAGVPFLAARSLKAMAPFDPQTRDLLLEGLAASASNLLILPIQDIFGWRDRVNTPGTVTGENWTWRLPWPVDDLRDRADTRARAETLHQWMHRYLRTGDPPAYARVIEQVSTTGRGRNALTLSPARRFRGRDHSREEVRRD